MKKHIITITGVPGSGKSSTADKLAKVLNYQRFSSGDFMRNIALDMGISLNELSKIAETDGGKVDTKIDDQVKSSGKQDNIVVDSRLAFHWIPESFKIFLDLPLEISKERIFQSLQNNKLRIESEGIADIDEIYRKINDRLESERKRYKELYGILNHTDPKNFDLVIDTNENNLEQVVEIVLKAYKEWLKS